MAKVMTAKKFASTAKDIAKNYKTLYIMGCFGAPMNKKNKLRYMDNCAYNRKPERRKMISQASADTFGFDCVCLIKGILWGWKGDTSATYGGAKYASNGVPDFGADSMLNYCSGVSTNFKNIQVGEVVWLKGHAGIYIGDGLVAECSPRWKNKVQITACANVGKKEGYNSRTWTKHGKLRFVDYSSEPKPDPTPAPDPDPKPDPEPSGKKVVKATNPAKSFDKDYNKTYTVNTKKDPLALRNGAGTNYKALTEVPKGSKVKCYGYYTNDWLYVVYETKTTIYEGYCNKAYLK